MAAQFNELRRKALQQSQHATNLAKTPAAKPHVPAPTLSGVQTHDVWHADVHFEQDKGKGKMSSASGQPSMPTVSAGAPSHISIAHNILSQPSFHSTHVTAGPSKTATSPGIRSGQAHARIIPVPSRTSGPVPNQALQQSSATLSNTNQAHQPAHTNHNQLTHSNTPACHSVPAHQDPPARHNTPAHHNMPAHHNTPVCHNTPARHNTPAHQNVPARHNAPTHCAAPTPSDEVPDDKDQLKDDNQPDNAPANDDNVVQETRRQQAQLKKFSRIAGPLVKETSQKIELHMLLHCPFPELTPSSDQGLNGNPTIWSLFDEWALEFWAETNAAQHPDQPVLELKH
ncbi:hypothetical protein FRC08_008982 [Ceratobasidium sp. 394]|nr:hypothetical protein FRC08_008982 [Ceratobasidium sp. 394]